MSIFLIADTHFYHTNIIKYENRPFNSSEEMNEAMLYNWNSIINNNDIVFHLGDVVFGGSEKVKEIVNKLNGRKILIMGNHDRRKTITSWLKAGFEKVYKNPLIIKNFILSHEPIYKPNMINIHGHVHSHVKDNKKIYKCVSVEVINYTPIKVEDLMKY